MPSLGTIARKIAGLPEPAEKTTAQTDAADWEAVGAELAAQQRGPVPAPARGVAAPWTAEPEKSGAVAARRLGRGLVWGVLGLAAITGIRSWVVPARVRLPPQTAPVTAPAYPEAAAQAVAARLARAYLTWDAEAPEARAAELAAIMPPGSDPAMGWDGKGRQDVTAVEPGAVDPGPGGRAHVRVEALLAAAGAGQRARWVALDVPVVKTPGGQVAVTGQPGFLGVPATGPKAPDGPGPVTDPELSQATAGPVREFFTAYADGSGTGTVTAPGARIPPLPDGIEFRSLDSWAIDTAQKGADRAGTALVTWSLGGASVQQTYRVVLTRVSSASAARWQVAGLKGGGQ
ncbi:hypothetical protein ACPXCP_39935 [Streptomyces sp. DT20]|uniref:conjugal transfer protein n=1 Tax=Streptomyces sp. DT20 TaxID=3416519 RepID=UPI003CF8E1F4